MDLTVRTTFAKYGATNWQKFSTPFEKLSEEEVMALLMNWTAKPKCRGTVIQIRIREVTDQEVYELWIKKKSKGRLRITQMEKRGYLKTRMLYKWDSTTTYNNLTRTKLNRSMEDADKNKCY